MLNNSVREKIKAAFSKGELSVLSTSPDTGEVHFSPVESVVRHLTPHKQMVRVILGSLGASVTEDHSLFLLEGGKPTEVLSGDIAVGDRLAVVLEGQLTSAPVMAVEQEPPCKHTYDLVVPGDENFVLSSGILAHNTYSISGISLDLDKSSKYQSMKDNLEQEWDKMLDAIKRSIKIVKGLQQPRYGIGISSALGPFSRAGIQSRSNYISGMGSWS